MAAALAASLVGCDEGNESSDSGAGGSEVEVTDAWARPTPAGTSAGAVYLTLRSNRDDALVGVSVDPAVAPDAMMHEHSAVNGQMSMDHSSRVELPADEDVVFEPGGYHVMLSDLAAPLTEGDSFAMTVEFETAATATVTVDVRDQAQ